MRVHVADHPLITHKLTVLRDQSTPSATFRALTEELVTLLAYEATRHVRTHEVTIQTPVAQTTGLAISEPRPLIVPILRAGLGMLQPFHDIFPDVSVGYVGLERDHETAIARSYYCKLPPLAEARVLVVDPMLATGGSAAQALTLVKAQGATEIGFVCIVAAPEGVKTLQQAHPEVPIHAGAVDRQLNSRKYILPGLGDFGDRLYGT